MRNKARKGIFYLCEDGLEKSVPCDHRLSSLDNLHIYGIIL